MGVAAPRRPAHPLPGKPMSLDEVLLRWPELTQTTLSKWDDCSLSAKWDLTHGRGWSSHAAAMGIVGHRAMAECLRTMKRQGEQQIEPAEALEILYEALDQDDIPPEDVVKVPVREQMGLRIAFIKWATSSTTSTERIVAIEQRLSTTVEYRTAGGRRVERVISGAPDVLIAPEHEGDPATVVDFKFGWGLPPEQEEHSQHPERGLSVEGYFQQRFYGLLVMDKYPALPAVQFNERYVRWGETRPATITREALEHVRREMAGLVKGLDRALMAGARSALWRPSPGKHCAFCLRPGQCPIEREARGEGAVTNARQAAQYAAERQVAQKVVKHRTAALRNWSDATGRPTPLKDAKGRRELGFVPRTTTIKPSLAELQAALAAGVDPATLYRTRNGAAFTDYTPAKSDRGPDDPALVEAMRKAVRA